MHEDPGKLIYRGWQPIGKPCQHVVLSSGASMALVKDGLPSASVINIQYMATLLRQQRYEDEL